MRNVPDDYNGYWSSKCPVCGVRTHPAEQPTCACDFCSECIADILIERYQGWTRNTEIEEQMLDAQEEIIKEAVEYKYRTMSLENSSIWDEAVELARKWEEEE